MKKTRKAFNWIITVLEQHKVPYRISGGFAAKIYGSTRPLADIDIEMPDKYFNKILPDIKKYIVKGPNRYKDKNWDIYVVSLKYKGQEIDLTGTQTARIFNKNSRSWVWFKADFSKIIKRKVFGKAVNLIGKKDLIDYKRKLSRRVDIKDIKEIS